ncbi:MAG: Omp28-related outer membrane protein, partial [Candidatus Cloacimonetes bacterium]|nr:Omp28-related outer membrane protein [Candidatus Cloacimonadota bacterium]
MKKVLVLVLTLTIGLCFAVPREHALLEIFTGTWCVYCPGIAMAADDFHNNGDAVSIIEYHNGDSYNTAEATARQNYYAVGGFPTRVWDGTDQHSGGNASSSLYNAIYPEYVAAMAVDSPVSLSWSGNLSATTLNITVNIDRDMNMTPSTMSPKLHFVITESHIADNWFVMNEVNFVMRKMYPNQNGTDLDFNTSNNLQQNYQIQLDGNWVIGQLEVIAFVQNHSTKEVMQSISTSIVTFAPNAPPSNLTGTYANNEVSLTWNAPGTRPLTGYTIYRNNTAIAQDVQNTSYVDNTVVENMGYSYYVTAMYNPEGESIPTNSVVVATLTGAFDEGFETGDFSAFNWQMSGNSNWITDTYLSHDGIYSAKSGAITHNQSSILSITRDALSDGSIVFARKISSEANYDFLKFSIDGVLIDEWSGNSAWEMEVYPVASGTHTYTWEYFKDNTVSGNSDSAWIDNILFPPLYPAVAFPTNLNYSLSDNNVNLTWQIQTRFLLGFKVYRDDVEIAEINDANVLTYDDTDLPSAMYHYHVTALHEEGESAPSTVLDVGLFMPVVNVQAETLQNGVALISWDAPIARSLEYFSLYINGNYEDSTDDGTDLDLHISDLIQGYEYMIGVEAVYSDGSADHTELIYTYTTGINDGVAIFETILSDNYPNPFNPETKISFDLKERGQVSVTVFD